MVNLVNLPNKSSFFDNIGIEFTAVSSLLKGNLYTKVDDFIVEEIHKDRICNTADKNAIYVFDASFPYLSAVLVKKNLSTFDACQQFAEANKINYSKDICFCGLKDTNGFTSQLICFKNVSLVKTKFDGFFLKDFEYKKEQIGRNSHIGNKFIIRVRDVLSTKETKQVLEDFNMALIKGLPNFYGPQRFGVRQNNHELGKLLLQNELDKFIFEFLTFSRNESEQIISVRKFIKENYANLEKCLDCVEKVPELSDEKLLLRGLIELDSKEKAIAQMKIASFCVDAYSSFIFNKVLSNQLKTNAQFTVLEKIGKHTVFDENTKEIFAPVLSEENILLDDFKKDSPIFNVHHHVRNSLFYPKNFNYIFEGKDLVLRFDLSNGEYASLVLGFLFENAYGKLN